MALASVTLTEILGMEWERDIEAGTGILHQRAFTEQLLKTFGFWQYSKPTKTSQAPSTRLGLDPISATPTLSCQSLCNAQGKGIWTRPNTG